MMSWDYSWSGYYFVTICVKDRKKFWFGEIKNGKMELNEVGKITEKFWKEIPKHFEFVDVDEFVIMPNHIHGIIVIKNKNFDDSGCVETRHVASLQKDEKLCPNKFGPLKPNSLQSIVHSYKATVKRWCNKNNFESFIWQPRFYEHVIRTEKTLEKIRDYIQYNPERWDADKNNPFSKKYNA